MGADGSDGGWRYLQLHRTARNRVPAANPERGRILAGRTGHRNRFPQGVLFELPLLPALFPVAGARDFYQTPKHLNVLRAGNAKVNAHQRRRMKPALVTGASGFVGWHVARLLLERGYKVRAL